MTFGERTGRKNGGLVPHKTAVTGLGTGYLVVFLQRGVRHKRNFLPQSGGECWAKYSARCRVLNAKRMWRAALAWAGPHYQTEIASHSDIDGDKPLFLTVIQPDSGACLTYTALSVRVHASKLEDNSH
jgi:hypothetical protein